MFGGYGLDVTAAPEVAHTLIFHAGWKRAEHNLWHELDFGHGIKKEASINGLIIGTTL
jgi:hypothetical protein